MEETKQTWTCPKCKRKFEKKGQTHSCAFYPVAKHLAGKEVGKKLYNALIAKMKKEIGKFRVESLPCCIHFVSTYTFAAVYALRDKIRIHFTLDHKLESPRIIRFSQIAAKRYMYSIDIKDEGELDKELLGWIKEASKTK
ncbi:hypothetical protein H0O01_03680 [Candidatus Micrarchaeota archaeon]|nr:hypothetical protein [Candidatus Micrarchaeota archaeon]